MSFIKLCSCLYSPEILGNIYQTKTIFNQIYLQNSKTLRPTFSQSLLPENTERFPMTTLFVINWLENTEAVYHKNLMTGEIRSIK